MSDGAENDAKPGGDRPPRVGRMIEVGDAEEIRRLEKLPLPRIGRMVEIGPAGDTRGDRDWTAENGGSHPRSS